MKIAVYCGSSSGDREEYAEGARKLGKMIAQKGHSLVYGGASKGLMGVIADAVLENGGKVTGVLPNIPLIQERRHKGLTEYVEADDITERKNIMLALADAYVALPGGAGTLDEVSDIMCLASLGLNKKPCVFYNILGYYEPLREMLEKMTASGFMTAKSRESLFFSDDIEEIAKIIKA